MTIQELRDMGISNWTAVKLVTRGKYSRNPKLAAISFRQNVDLAECEIRVNALEITWHFKGWGDYEL